MRLLTRAEEFILLAIWKLKDNAYGVTIRDHLKETTGKTWAFGALFVMLSRLEERGHVVSELSSPTPVRGGRSKRVYQLTPSAFEALDQVHQVERAAWKGLPDPASGKSE